MRRPGQPLRFLGWTVGGWVVMRVTMALIPAVEGVAEPTKWADSTIAQESDKRREAVRGVLRGTPAHHAVTRMAQPAMIPHERAAFAFADGGEEQILPTPQAARPDSQSVFLQPSVTEATGTGPALVMALRAMPERKPSAPGRWSATAWMLWRAEVAGGLAQAPLLGGSQLGARLDYRLTNGRLGQLGLYGRVSRALSGAPAEEAALGVLFRPTRAPVAVLAERRQRLGRGGRNGFALLVAGGVGPRKIAPRLAVEGYAQAGMVGLPGLDGFADGKANLGYRLSPVSRPARLMVGASLSGSVQPGAGRLDIGPEVSLRLPAGPANLRLSVEWRERILGDARPARGPAVTLVSDF